MKPDLEPQPCPEGGPDGGTVPEGGFEESHSTERNYAVVVPQFKLSVGLCVSAGAA